MVQLSLIAVAAFATLATAEKASVKKVNSSFKGAQDRRAAIKKNAFNKLATPSIRGAASVRDLKGKPKAPKLPKAPKASKGSKAKPGEYGVGLTMYDDDLCEGAIVLAEILVLNTCETGIDFEGFPYSRFLTSNLPGEEISVVESWYDGNNCEGTAVESFDFATELMLLPTSTYGDCIVGIEVDYLELDGDLNPGFNSVIVSSAASLSSCASGKFSDHIAHGADFCYSDDDVVSFKYSDVTACATTGSVTYSTYTDSECTMGEVVNTVSIAESFCKFNLANVFGIEDGDTELLHYEVLTCITAE